MHPGKADCLVLDFVDDGVPIELDIEADLSRRATSERQVKAPVLQPGDMVRLRHGDRGVGTVMSVGDVTCRVMWPGRGVDVHGLAELRKATVQEMKTVPINLQVIGVTEHAIEIMPGETAKAAIGWFYSDSVWSAHGETHDGMVASLLYRSTSGPWRCWFIEWQGRRCTRAFKAAEGTDLLALRQRMSHLMRSRGARPIDHTDPRYRKPATDAQRAQMELLRIPMPTGNVTRGEARQLIARKRAGDEMDNKIREYKRRHVARRGGRR